VCAYDHLSRGHLFFPLFLARLQSIVPSGPSVIKSDILRICLEHGGDCEPDRVQLTRRLKPVDLSTGQPLLSCRPAPA
jgi:hypothetical protein